MARQFLSATAMTVRSLPIRSLCKCIACMNCGDTKCNEGIPRRLHWCKREIVQHFSPVEKLFRRIVLPKETANESNLRDYIWTPMSSDRLSVNRSAFSIMSDVDINTKNGKSYDVDVIAEFQVKEILDLQIPFKNPSIPNSKVEIFSFCILHVPERCMYPHSEIALLRNNISDKRNIPKSVKAIIRDKLASIMKSVNVKE